MIRAEAISRRLDRENRFLHEELKVAKKKGIYFIFNLKDRVISIKARGVTLRELRVEKVRFWGDYFEIKPRTLRKKSALFKPEREEIKPHQPEDTKRFELDALELEDMPSNYGLLMDDNISVSVRAKARGVFSWAMNFLAGIKWYIWRPLQTLWNFVKREPFSAIYLELDKEQARMLYWYFTEGSVNLMSSDL
ncbi:MAG: hypothetical protein AB1797_03705 [bacterium]